MLTLGPPPVPAEFSGLRDEIVRAGGRVYLVGGSVRDHLLGAPVKDWDLEVFGLDHDKLYAVLRRRGAVNTVGRSFGVLKWRPTGAPDLEVDVSIPRRDSKVGPGHRGIAVEGDPAMSTREAARRRDLTINAISWDLAEGRYEDPCSGLADLEAGVLRAVDIGTFLEDPLRALRVVQFAARLGFRPDPPLIALCAEAPLDELPAERISGEWGKLLLKGRELTLGFAVARETHVLQRVFPWAADLNTDSIVQRAVPIRDQVEGEGRRWALMLGAWLHPAPPLDVEHVLDRLGLFTVRGYAVRDRLREALAAQASSIDTDAALRHLSTASELDLTLHLRALITDQPTDAARANAEALGILRAPPPPILLGRHLRSIVEPGPAMGVLLAQVYQAQLDGEVIDLDQAKAWVQRRISPPA
jgi:tRNA nucleotidyltransferase (CCA-adding enzyme)